MSHVRFFAGVGLLAVSFTVWHVVQGAAQSFQSISNRPVFTPVGNVTRAPTGWVDFCLRNKRECDTKPSTPRDIDLSEKTWDDLIKVNKWVNDTVKFRAAMDHWGVVEKWSYPDDGYGDTEDYALLKRKMLIQAGWPREALLMTVARDKKGWGGTVVLTVKTNRGEFILDKQATDVLAWNKTGYEFVKRQSQSDPNVWVGLDVP